MQENIDNATEYRKAIKDGNIINAKSLISRLTIDEINKLGKDRKTLLTLAVENGNNEVVEYLLKKGAEPNKPDGEGNTPFMIALGKLNKGKNKKNQIAKTLLEGGLDVNSEHNTATGKAKPIQIATYLGSNELVKFISSLQGVSIDEHNIFGKPIEIAIGKCNIDMTKILVEGGANLSNANRTTGYKPIHFAIDSHFFSNRILKFLLKQGGVDYLTENEEKKTPLHIAICKKNLEAIELLLLAKANLNKRDAIGNTALHYASLNGLESVVNNLLDANANTDIVNNDGKTALDIAKSQNNEVIIKALETKSKKSNISESEFPSPFLRAQLPQAGEGGSYLGEKKRHITDTEESKASGGVGGNDKNRAHAGNNILHPAQELSNNRVLAEGQQDADSPSPSNSPIRPKKMSRKEDSHQKNDGSRE